MALTSAEKQKRYRAKHKVTESVTIGNGNAPVTDDFSNALLGHYQGGLECECRMCANWRAKGKDTALLHHGQFRMDANQLALMDRAAGVRDVARNRVSLPGDLDYGVE